MAAPTNLARDVLWPATVATGRTRVLGLRYEGAPVDPDGNVIRFGSPIGA